MEYIEKNRTLSIATALAVLVIAVMAFFYYSGEVEGRAPTGLQVDFATSGPVNLGDQTALMAIATSTGCSARVITTRASDILLAFADGVATPTSANMQGHFQGASTTVAYDADTYGCGRIIAFPMNDTQITITETR